MHSFNMLILNSSDRIFITKRYMSVLLTGIRKITKPCFSHILHQGDETDQQYQTR